MRGRWRNAIKGARETVNRIKSEFAELSQELVRINGLLEQQNVELKNEVTLRIAAEKALWESQSIYFALTQNSTDGIILRDDTGIITYANYAFAKMMQAEEPSELLGHFHMEYVHPDDREECLRRLASVTAGDSGFRVGTSVGWFAREGNLCGCDRRTPFPQTVIFFSMGIFHDITDRKHATQLVREKDEILRTVIETIPDMIWLKNPEGLLPELQQDVRKVLRGPGRRHRWKNRL